LPDADHVQTVLTHVDHLSWSGEGSTLVDLGGYGLVDRPDDEGHQEGDQSSAFLIQRVRVVLLLGTTPQFNLRARAR
jgi:hypothetical protein